MTSGATGAPGERDWNIKITDMLYQILKDKAEVYICDAFANKDKKVTETDWDLFLAVHYDSDSYKDSGGFVDTPDPSIDFATKESNRIAKVISDYYFSTTSIKNMPRRSNANTKFYYMWSALTPKTPCVLIECGVGWRKPDDYEILRKYDFIANTIAKAITLALNIDDKKEEINTCQQDLKEMRESRNKWKSDYQKLEKEFDLLQKDYDNLKKEHLNLDLEHKKYRDNINTLLKEKSELAGHIDRLKQELTRAGQTIETLVTENRNLIEKINTNIADMKLIDLIKAIIERLKKG